MEILLKNKDLKILTSGISQNNQLKNLVLNSLILHNYECLKIKKILINKFSLI